MEFLKKTDIDRCVEILKSGKILAFPTETVFGLGVISNSEEAFNELVKVKRRSPDKPFTLMCGNLEQVKDLIEINEISEKLINKFMPGCITLVLKTKKHVPNYLDLGTGFVGVRIPDDEFVRELILKVGKPLLVPSANKANEEPAKTDKKVNEYFNDEIAAIVEGECYKNNPSTVVKVDGNIVKILREGPVLEKEIMEVITK